jgi:hypothetical protein
MADFIPYILSFFSNAPEGTQDYLSYVDEEEKGLDEIFSALIKREGIKIAYKLLSHRWADDPVTGDSILSSIDQFKDINTIIHYSGHATKATLTTEQGDLRSQNFIKRLNLCKKLRVVVLNACSTQGFVKELLETTNVDAVIATTNPVRDDRAMLFSKEFYTKLTERYSLAEAFIQGLTVALRNEYQNDSYVYKVIPGKDNGYKIVGGTLLLDSLQPGAMIRGTKSNLLTILDKADEPATWGLYTKTYDILDWKLYDSALPVESKREALEKERKRLRIVMGMARDKQAEPKKRLAEYQARLEKDPDDQLFKKLISETDAEVRLLQIEIDQQERLIDGIEKELAQLSENIREEDILTKYKNNFWELNYTTQETFVDSVRARSLDKTFQGFFLHGTPDCCLDYLSKKIAAWLGTSNIKRIDYDFGSRSIGDFWQVLKNDLDRDSPHPDTKPEAIVQRLYNHFADGQGGTQKDIVFLFRNIGSQPGSDNRVGRILSFWKQLEEHWKACKPAESLKPIENLWHHIYAFLIDGTCELTLAPQLKSSREDEYQGLIDKAGLFQNPIVLVPVVAPLKADEIEGWERKDCKLEPRLRFPVPKIDSLLQKTGGYFRTTLQTMTKNKLCNPAKQNDLLSYIKQDIETAQI